MEKTSIKHKLILVGMAILFLVIVFSQLKSCASNIAGGFSKDTSSLMNPDSLNGKIINEDNVLKGIMNPETGLFSETGKATIKEADKVQSGISSFFTTILIFILFVGAIVIYIYAKRK